MKQINQLEKELQVVLFYRSKKGLILTPAGEIIYKHSLNLIEYSKNAVFEARNSSIENEKVFCIGSSLLNPAKPFIDLWYNTNNGLFKDYKIHLVPYDDLATNILNEIDLLGVIFDFLIGVCNSKKWLKRYNFFQLGTYKKMIAMNKNHPLANKRIITIDDLKNYTLMMVSKGDSPINDEIREKLMQHNIKIEDTNTFYDMSVFNECAETNKVLLSLECWTNVHPSLVTIPFDLDYSIPYGLLYSLRPTKDILLYINPIKEYIKIPYINK